MASPTAIKEKNAKIVTTYGRSAKDTGLPEVQIALLTDRINDLNGHFSKHVMDFHSKQGLLKLVGKRRRLLDYLKREDEPRYEALIKKLEIRK